MRPALGPLWVEILCLDTLAQPYLWLPEDMTDLLLALLDLENAMIGSSALCILFTSSAYTLPVYVKETNCKEKTLLPYIEW